MLKKILVLVLVLVFAACPLVGCGGDDAPAAPPAADKPADAPADAPADKPADLGKKVELNLSSPYSITDYRGCAMEDFAALCDEMSGGNIKITVFPNATLATSQDAVKSVANGSAHMACGALSFNVSEIPALAPLDIAGIYDPTYFWETYDVIKPTLDKILAEQNQMTLIMFDESELIFYLNEKNAKEVHSPADIKGLRLRDHGTWVGKSISSWGASPMTVMPADLAVALERGTVDGGFTGWAFVYQCRGTDSAPYVTYTGLGKSCWAPLTISLDVFNDLTPAQQEIILEAAAIAEENSNTYLAEYEAEFQASIEELGGTIYEMTTDETQVFVDATAPLIEEVRGIAGELGNELVDALLSAPSDYR